MAKIQNRCPKCDKVLVELKRFSIKSTDFISYACGHTLSFKKLEAKKIYDITFKDGRKLFPFQAETVKFLCEKANHRAGVFHDMGLGKTIIAIGDLYLNPELLPCLVICKSALKIQWFKEFFKLTGWIPQIIEGQEQPATEIFKIGIVSYDLLRNAKWVEDNSYKTIILDECQSIKNHNSKRTNHVRKACVGKDYIIPLSGTPIKNHAGEYFPILNILRPEIFYGLQPYLNRYVDVYYDGYKDRIGGLRNADEFFERTKDFIIRYTREQVMPDLPPIRRSFQYHELGLAVQEEYDKVYKKFVDEYEEDQVNLFNKTSNLLSYMTRMRHLTALSKINPCIDFLKEFLEATNEKVVVFTHHKDAHAILKMHLQVICKERDIPPPLEIIAEQNGQKRNEMVMEFSGENAENAATENPAAIAKQTPRIILVSTLAGGEGLDGLQKACSTAVVLERQWNPANEEQAEKRLSRIGSIGNVVNVTYPVAIGTIDEFFAELVENKRAAMALTLDNLDYDAHDTPIMRELANLLYEKGRKRWRPVA